MALSMFWQRLDLKAAAYLIEIIISAFLFLGPYKKRAAFGVRVAVTMPALIIAGMLMGIPTDSSILRFFGFFITMAFVIAAVCFYYKEDFFTLLCACVAGFATQHIANKITILLDLIPTVAMISQQSVAMHAVFEVLVFSYVYLLSYFLFGRSRTGAPANRHLSVLSVVIILTCIGVNRLVMDNAVGNVYFEIAACIYAILCCYFALIIQFTVGKWEQADTERVMIEQLFSESKKQYEQWSVNAGKIREWIHDLRHLLDRVERLASKDKVEIPDLSAVRAAVDSISPTVKTGNDALDVLLRNMDDLCRQNGITLHCVAYADCLKYFDGMKLYFLFANAIDNAMEGVSGITDPEKRIIEVTIRAFGDSASISIWNFFSGNVRFAEGLPVSSKNEEAHGFGMKSMQRIVDEFDGVMDAHIERDVFHLNIMLPISR